METILNEIFETWHSLDPRVATYRGTYQWQIAKVFATKYLELDAIQSSIVDEISLKNCVGVALDFHGITLGIFRKGAERSIVDVKCTGVANNTLIPLGSKFSTEKGIEFETTQDAILPNIIAMQRTVGKDVIPAPYSGVTSIEWINTTPNNDGTEYVENTDWTYYQDEITWIGDEPAEGTTYFIGLVPTENVSTSIEAVSVEFGSATRVSIGQITVNMNGIEGITSVVNDYESTKGNDVEVDDRYRNRLLQTVNTTFGYPRIAGIIAGIVGVRACNVIQDTGVDLAFPAADWDVAGTWSTFETLSLYGLADDVPIAQSFIPSSSVITLHDIGIYAQKVGNPPPLVLRFYRWKTDYATTISKYPLDEQYFTVNDIDPDYPDDWQEIRIKCRHGGLDWTKTYLFVIETSDSTSDVDNHWKVKYQATGNEYADGIMYKDGVAINGGASDLAFKTLWGGASFTSVVAVEDGYDFGDIKDQIESELLDFETNRAVIPVCIQSNVVQADEAEINVTCVVFINNTSDWVEVNNLARSGIYNYLDSLGPGQNVIFSVVESIIMSVPGVLKILNCTIQKNSETPITKAEEYDIVIGKNEVPTLGTPGTTFTQGVM